MAQMTLDELVASVLDVELRDADPEREMAYLHMANCQFDTDGNALSEPERVMAALAVGPGPVIAAVARMLVATAEPSSAAISLPSWTAKMPVGQDLKTYGVSQVKDLPADMVQDSLVVYGEDLGGASVTHAYVIERDGDGKRVWVEQKGIATYHSRFEPLFILPKMVNTALSALNAEAFGLTPVEARFHAKRAALSVLKTQVERVMK